MHDSGCIGNRDGILSLDRPELPADPGGNCASRGQAAPTASPGAVTAGTPGVQVGDGAPRRCPPTNSPDRPTGDAKARVHEHNAGSSTAPVPVVSDEHVTGNSNLPGRDRRRQRPRHRGGQGVRRHHGPPAVHAAQKPERNNVSFSVFGLAGVVCAACASRWRSLVNSPPGSRCCCRT
jgi:hypothetical protein